MPESRPDLDAVDRRLIVATQAGLPRVSRPYDALALEGAPWVAASAVVDPSACLIGATAVGAGALVGAGAVLEDTVVWAGARILPGSELRRCIVTSEAVVSGVHTNADL